MTRMTAVTQYAYGGVGTLELGEVDIPRPDRGEALVRVQAAAIDRGTWHLMTGVPRLARLAVGLRRPRRAVPGLDVAGVVEAVGLGGDPQLIGRRVFGIAKGSLAEFAVADLGKLAVVPECLAPGQAAALGVSGLTALQALDAARITKGGSVLVLGASGGVGSFAVKIAVIRGARVVAVCSAAKAGAVRSWGAQHVVDYRSADLAAITERFDAVIDVAGGTSLDRLRDLTAEHGAIVFVGHETGGTWTGGYGRPMRRALRMIGARQRYVMLVAKERAVDLDRLAALAEREGLRPHLHATMPLDSVQEAMTALVNGEVVGKVVLQPGAPRGA